MRTPWTGCGTALVTPFTRDGAVDDAGVRRLARRQIDAGIHFLVPCGTTGEIPTLSEIMDSYRTWQPQSPEPLPISAYIFGLCRMPTLQR